MHHQPYAFREHVEPLFHGSASDIAGYRILGAAVGPTALVTGDRATVSPVFHRIVQLPGLPRLRGRLVLAYLDSLAASGKLRNLGNLTPENVDRSIFITFHAPRATPPDVRARVQHDAYWSILRLCANLGMISGRGVPQNPPSA